MTKKQFDVTGMTCSSCSAHVEKAVRLLSGIESVSVNLLTNSMSVSYDEAALSPADISRAVSKAGYGASEAGAKTAEAPQKTRAADETDALKHRFILSLCLLVPLMYVAMYHMLFEWFALPIPPFMHTFFHGPENAVTFALTQLILCLPILYINRSYFIRGFKALWNRSPNMDSLIALGSSAAMLYGVFALYRIGWGLGHGDIAAVEHYSMDLYFESAGTILTLITLGKFLEAKSKRRTGSAIEKLMNLAPKTALLLRDGAEVQVPVEDVVPGDTVVLKPGSAVPVDGVVLTGHGGVDESAITGESMPVDKAPGDTVISATINRSGYLIFRATKVGDDTTIAAIVRLVEEASASKAPIAQLADRISGIFVPVVIGIALLAAVVWLLVGASVEFAISVGIAVLVISCPCALGLATPVAIMVGTGKGAENGILIKSGEALETAHSIDTVVLDKTGTITEGKPRVTDVHAVTCDGDTLLKIAVSLESKSEHPLALAILEHGAEAGIVPRDTENFSAVFGRGLSGEIDGKLYYGGNSQMLLERGIPLSGAEAVADAFAEDGKTPLFFADETALLGVIAVADTVKPTSAEAIRAFKKLGIRPIMLTGDNARTAAAIQRKLDIPEVIAEVLPEEKEQKIAALRESGHKVAMVGDGVNDAPALVRADVGIAIGAGVDVAVESADIVLIRGDLLDAVTAVRLSRAVMRNIKQNLFWAFFYNTIGIPLAAGVFFTAFALRLNPMFGAAAMSLSSVCVVANALRLKFFKAHAHTASPSESGVLHVKIDGMMCDHCVGTVSNALNALDGVTASVSLESHSAAVRLSGTAGAREVRRAVENAGYKVISTK